MLLSTIILSYLYLWRENPARIDDSYLKHLLCHFRSWWFCCSRIESDTTFHRSLVIPKTSDKLLYDLVLWQKQTYFYNQLYVTGKTTTKNNLTITIPQMASRIFFLMEVPSIKICIYIFVLKYNFLNQMHNFLCIMTFRLFFFILNHW